MPWFCCVPLWLGLMTLRCEQHEASDEEFQLFDDYWQNELARMRVAERMVAVPSLPRAGTKLERFVCARTWCDSLPANVDALVLDDAAVRYLSTPFDEVNEVGLLLACAVCEVEGRRCECEGHACTLSDVQPPDLVYVPLKLECGAIKIGEFSFRWGDGVRALRAVSRE